LEFICQQPKDDWLGGPHDFTITNPDAQKATMSFKIFKVVEIKIAAADTAGVAALTITGECLDDKFVKVECTKQDGTRADVSEPKSSSDQTQYTASVAGLKTGDTVNVAVADTSSVKVLKVVTVQKAPTPKDTTAKDTTPRDTTAKDTTPQALTPKKPNGP
jgi:hypothetical protein